MKPSVAVPNAAIVSRLALVNSPVPPTFKVNVAPDSTLMLEVVQYVALLLYSDTCLVNWSMPASTAVLPIFNPPDVP